MDKEKFYEYFPESKAKQERYQKLSSLADEILTKCKGFSYKEIMDAFDLATKRLQETITLK